MNECIINLGAINWLTVGIATIAAYILGALWYSKALFGKLWMKLEGFTEEDLKKGGIKAMLITLITTFLTSFVMATVIATWGINFWGHAIPLSILFGLFLYAGNQLSDFLYSRRPLKLFWITATYRILMIFVITLILILWK